METIKRKFRYYVTEKEHLEKHAGAKARNDVSEILLQNGWTPVTVHYNSHKNTASDRLKMLFVVFMDWFKVFVAVPVKGTLFIQLPLATYPKVSMAALPFLHMMKWKKVFIIGLVHDLDSLRGGNGAVEQCFTSIPDILIVHSPAMKEYLQKKGIDGRKLRILWLFDYLVKDRFIDKKKRERNGSIAITGNLNHEKAEYVYHLPEWKGKLRFFLYGPNYDGAGKAGGVAYQGTFHPDELPERLDEDFGLVWDGASLKTCEGAYGNYLKYNAPHKVSMYLVAGLPIIVWNESSLAEFVKKEHIGITVRSLWELEKATEHISREEYAQMRASVRELAVKLTEGRMLEECIKEWM